MTSPSASALLTPTSETLLTPARGPELSMTERVTERLFYSAATSFVDTSVSPISVSEFASIREEAGRLDRQTAYRFGAAAMVYASYLDSQPELQNQIVDFATAVVRKNWDVQGIHDVSSEQMEESARQIWAAVS